MVLIPPTIFRWTLLIGRFQPKLLIFQGEISFLLSLPKVIFHLQKLAAPLVMRQAAAIH